MSTDKPVTLVKREWLAPVLLAVTGLTALLILPGLSFYYDVTPKIALLLAGSALGLALPWPLRDARLSREFRWLRALLAAQAVSVAVSALLSADRALVWSGTNWRRFGVVTQWALLAFVWLTARVLAAQGRIFLLRLLRVTAAAGALSALYGAAQYLGWDPLLPGGTYHFGEGLWAIVRPPGTLGHAAYFATFLLLATFAGAGLLLVERKRRWRLLGAVAVALCAFGVVLSGTRAALLGLIAGGALLCFCLRPRISRRKAAAVTALAAGLLLFYFSPYGWKLRSRAHWSSEDIRGGARIQLWRDTLRMGSKHWLAGAGPETFTSRFPQYRSPELARAYPDFFQESPHNIFLDAFAAQGAPGFAILAAIFGLGFWSAYRARESEPLLAGVLGASLTAALASQQFTSFTESTALYTWITVAMLVGLTPRPEQTDPRRTHVPQPLGYGLRLASALLFVWFGTRVVAADGLLEGTRKQLQAGRVSDAAREYERAASWQPPGMNADLWYSRALLEAATKSPDAVERLRALVLGKQAAVRAAAYSEDRPNACYNLAAYYARENDFGRTEKALHEAIAWSPTWYKPHWMLAQVLYAAGRLREARSEAERAVSLSGGKHGEVNRTRDQLQSAAEK